MRRMTVYLFSLRIFSFLLFLPFITYSTFRLAWMGARAPVYVCVAYVNEFEQACIAQAIWSVSKCLFFHERKIDSFNSMTSVFGNRITLVAHTRSHTRTRFPSEFHLWCECHPFPTRFERRRSMPLYIQLNHTRTSYCIDGFRWKTYSMLDVWAWRYHFFFISWQSFYRWMRLNGEFLLHILLLLLFMFLRVLAARMHANDRSSKTESRFYR